MDGAADEGPAHATEFGHLPLRDRVVAISTFRFQLAVVQVDWLAAEVQGDQPPVDLGNRRAERLGCLEKMGGNKRQAARLLQLSRTTLIDKLHRLNLNERVSAA